LVESEADRAAWITGSSPVMTAEVGAGVVTTDAPAAQTGAAGYDRDESSATGHCNGAGWGGEHDMVRWAFPALLVLLASLGAPARAEPAFVPGIIFDMGGKFDKSFNEAAYVGAERFRKETGIAYREFEITNESQREQALANMARHGVGVIVAIGFTQRSPVETVARKYPKVKFTIIDAVVDLPNVQSIVYREQEGAFLVGMLAAMKSATGKIGFVGGMDIPLIRKFELGYEEGARYADPKIEVLQNMTGTTPAAWADPTRGAELARSQFDRGVDVVFAAAGTTGLGVLQAAKDAGKLSIGSDSNQNYLHPGSVLTSMLKRVDIAVYRAFTTARDGTWKPGTQVLGLAEDGVGYAIDQYDAALITPAMKAKVDAARADIIAGRIKVTDYMAK
jgi:basic membrane protein A and related proteins